MISPKDITNFSRSKHELQSFFLFGLFCAGKNSDYASRCLSRLLSKNTEEPFETLKKLGEIGIHNALVASRIGQYSRLTKGIMQALNLDLATCSLDDLMNIHGVGPKTARFFLLHTRAGCECAVLDTHILKFLRDHQVDAPKNTPTNYKQYLELEKKFIYLAKINFPSMTLADIDLTLWMKYSGRLDEDQFQ